jgi:hypothetical protein
MPVLQPKQESVHEQVLPIDDVDLAAHLLHKCPAKWQTQYDLTEKTTPVNTRALLLILEKIKNNAEVETKPPSVNQQGLKACARWSLSTPASPKCLNK